MKVQQLEAELQDLSSQESKDEASLAKVKKQLRDLEAKVKDQEEELDEQAGSIQMLEQVQMWDFTPVWRNIDVFTAKSCSSCYLVFSSAVPRRLLFGLCLSIFVSYVCHHHVLRLSCGLRWRWRGSDRPTPKRSRVKMKR